MKGISIALAGVGFPVLILMYATGIFRAKEGIVPLALIGAELTKNSIISLKNGMFG